MSHLTAEGCTAKNPGKRNSGASLFEGKLTPHKNLLGSSSLIRIPDSHGFGVVKVKTNPFQSFPSTRPRLFRRESASGCRPWNFLTLVLSTQNASGEFGDADPGHVLAIRLLAMQKWVHGARVTQTRGAYANI